MFTSPGVHLEVETFYVHDLVFRSTWTDYLVEERPDVTERHFTIVETNDVQVAMVYADQKLFQVLPPAKRVLFWRGPAQVTAEIVDVLAEPEALEKFGEDIGDLDSLVDNLLRLDGPAGK